MFPEYIYFLYLAIVLLFLDLQKFFFHIYNKDKKLDHTYFNICCSFKFHSYWIQFFQDAGIPASESANYAVTFCDHRIQEDMLQT